MDEVSGSEKMKEEYRQYTLRKILFIAFSLIGVVVFFFISLCVGTLELSVSEVYRYLFDHLSGVTYPVGSVDEFNDRIVFDIRVPRALFAIIAGAALGIAGNVMQNVMKNPLADPYTTGVSSGALFGVAVAMILGFSINGNDVIDEVGVLINAVVFAMVPVIFIVILAPYFRKSGPGNIHSDIGTIFQKITFNTDIGGNSRIVRIQFNDVPSDGHHR